MKQLAFAFTFFLGLLLLIACDGGRRQQMEALLDRADSLNRAYVPMTGGLDSLLTEATRYYDRHGTPNEQVRAHYLLGCAHRDMGEAPAALTCYQQAVDRADTLAEDCDYQRLMAVYGQMADLFDEQNLPIDELEVMEKYRQYALKEKDTLKYIRNLELTVKPYYLLNDTAKLCQILMHIRELYVAHGYRQQSLSVNGLLAHIKIMENYQEEARKLMFEYEKGSGLFDTLGNIAKGREYYYYTKGMYYQREKQFEKADYYYHKLLPYKDSIVAYKGLLSLYQEQFNADSIAKFARLYEHAIDKYEANLQTTVVHQMAALYDYQHFQRIAEQSEKAMENSKRRLHAFLLLSSLLLLSLIYAYYSFRRRKQQETAKLYFEYRDILAKYYKSVADAAVLTDEKNQLEILKSVTERELEDLKGEKDKQILAKTQEIAALKEQLSEYQSQVKDYSSSKKLLDVLNHDIVKSLHQRVRKRKNFLPPSDAEWKEVDSVLMKGMPYFYTVMRGVNLLSVKEHRVCILLLLNFSADEICVLTD